MTNSLREALDCSSLATGLLARCAFPPDEHLHCAVSGGADSLALLLLACRLERRVTAWHVNHGLRTDADGELSQVRATAEALGAEVESRIVTVEPGPNLEARARDARFKVLPPEVLTGHTADDQAETVLINLLRGSGSAGMAGMRTARHPILGLRRHETQALCAELNVTPLHDSMNDDERFQRVRIRHEVLPLLATIAKRDVVNLLARQSAMFRDDNDLLDELAAMIDVTDARALSLAPTALARRAVRQWLANPLPPSAAMVERVLTVARGDAMACELGGGRSVRRSRQRLSLHDGGVL